MTGCDGAGKAETGIEFTAVSGERVSPLKVEEKSKARVMIFTTVDCPIANGYAPEINRLATLYGEKGFEFLLIHVDPDVTSAKAKTHGKAYGYEMATVIDGKHQLVKQFGVEVTPEVVVLLKNGEIGYQGRIDNLYADLGVKRTKVTVKDLENALVGISSGKGIWVKRTKAIGCFVPEID